MSAIEHVSDTAFWVATFRADEGQRADALFHDPLAARLVEGRGRAIAARMSGRAMTEWMVAIRTRVIDDFVRDAVAQGFDTVLNLGAGLDTRPYRMDLPAELRWIEADFPAVIEYKEQILAGEQPRCRLERCKVDLGDPSARRALLDEIDARLGRPAPMPRWLRLLFALVPRAGQQRLEQGYGYALLTRGGQASIP